MHKIAIYDSRMPEIMVHNLRTMGFIPVSTLDLGATDSALDTHPDIQICKIDSNFIVAEPSVYSYYEKNLSKYGIIVRQGYSKVSRYYPEDSFYNCAVGNGLFITNKDSTDKAILEECEDLEYIEVNQGYTKCNVLFTRDGVITSDMGIFKKVPEPRLLISPGSIKLDGFSYGFIGGASGYYDDVLYFTGDIKSHPDYHVIEEFLDRENTKICRLSEGDLEDYGSLIFLEGD